MLKDYENRKWRGISLWPMEAELLFILHVRATEFVPLIELIEFIYPDPDLEPEYAVNVMRVTLCRLRKKFGKNLFTSWYGRGYMINSDLQEARV